ncbi:class I SAM-dependent methyltransferase [Pinibacter soli]|uniref:Class I SAM-dependent methyltransferase n=1 Tax=Pinibacter soli TaxID=3044211 RepID=A0ABT6RH04_9BACT|nr:class I SAM-dependent methyltransferase [Pinibacter soli]MDI3321751.1 class I SAM-dependent methyltransferase [Pinibacter soli]
MDLQANWFKDWFNSQYYHQLYFKRDEKEAAEFIHLLIEKLNPPADSLMLDVACGKGRHSKILANHGFDITGIDISPDSIAEAKESEDEHLHFFVQDMRLPFMINYFDYAFNFFTSFGYFKSEREHYNAIRSIAQSLKANGTLIVDYLNVHYAEDHLIHKADKEIDGINFFITKWFDETHFYKKIVVEDDDLTEPLEYTEKVAKFTLGDFNDMFAYYNLQIQEVYGDYHFGAYDVRKSPRLIMIAKKVVG